MQTLEEGDLLERENIDWIRNNIPEYEYIWTKYIGNNGASTPLNIIELSEELSKNRESFYQAHYTLLRALISMRDISSKLQETLCKITDYKSYIEIQNDLILFMTYLGQIRDMFKKMDTALKLKGSVWKEYDEFYAKRSVLLHGSIPSQQLDEEGMLLVANPAGAEKKDEDWHDESKWSQHGQLKFVYISDLVNKTLNDVLLMIRASLSKLLDRLKEIFPNEVTMITKDDYLNNTLNSPISASGVCISYEIDMTKNK